MPRDLDHLDLRQWEGEVGDVAPEKVFEILESAGFGYNALDVIKRVNYDSELFAALVGSADVGPLELEQKLRTAVVDEEKLVKDLGAWAQVGLDLISEGSSSKHVTVLFQAIENVITGCQPENQDMAIDAFTNLLDRYVLRSGRRNKYSRRGGRTGVKDQKKVDKLLSVGVAGDHSQISCNSISIIWDV